MADLVAQQTPEPTKLPLEAQLPPRPVQTEYVMPWSGARIDEAKFLEIAEGRKDRAELVAAMRDAGIHVIFFNRTSDRTIRPAENLNDVRDGKAANFYATNAAKETDLAGKTLHYLPPGHYHNLDAAKRGDRRPLDDRPLLLLIDDVDRKAVMNGLVHALAKTEPLQNSGKLNVDEPTRLRLRDRQLAVEDIDTVGGLLGNEKKSFTAEEATVASEFLQIRLKVMLTDRDADVVQFLDRHSKRVGLDEAYVINAVDRTIDRIEKMRKEFNRINDLLPLLPVNEEYKLHPLLDEVDKRITDFARWGRERFR
jgi:hypothetical protein